MKTLLFAGDSITDGDHLWEGGPYGLGHGFVHQIARVLYEEKGLKDEYQILNRGYNGFRAADLYRRWEELCLASQPDQVTLLVGVNEAGASLQGMPEMVTTREQYAYTCEQIITDTQEQTGADMILMEPFLFSRPAYLLNWRTYLQEYQQALAELAVKYSLTYIPLDKTLNERAEVDGISALSFDGIHLTDRGNQILCELWLEAVWGKI